MQKKLSDTNKKPISSTLKNLEPGQTANFGYQRYSSVVCSITRMHTETDKRFSTQKNADLREVIVTRTI